VFHGSSFWLAKKINPRINAKQGSKQGRLKYLRSDRCGVNMLAKQTFSAFSKTFITTFAGGGKP
jgi:hypothetical protein